MLKYGKQTNKIAESKGFASAFPKRVTEAAKRLPTGIDKSEYPGRRDLTGELIITIDGDTAKDFDDAVSLTVENGAYKLGVHIADVAEFVRAGTPPDAEALARATSVYFPGEVRPMLPRELSDELCSLKPDEDRLCLSVAMEIDGEGQVTGYEIFESVIHSAARMTYREADQILSGGGEGTAGRYERVAPMLRDMRTLMWILNKRRAERGSVDFDLPESEITLDGSGEPTALERAPRNDANKLIEEFMLVCNETVARHARNRRLPFIYRVHEPPSAEKSEAFYTFCAGLGAFKGIRRGKTLTSKNLAGILKQAAGTAYGGLLDKVALRSMMKAKYKPVNEGHFGLAAEFYCHFTSPIRRYPDLFVHRVLKAELRGELTAAKKAAFKSCAGRVADQSGERETAAEHAERSVDDLYKAVYMKRYLGDEFDAVISGVTSFGIFAELPNTAEGLIWIESLERGLKFVEDKYLLYGKKASYRMGDKIRVKVVRCDADNGKIEFIKV
ncbi:MAG: VacB/RNase II family 3'-5' exoribonuclease [Clostridiales bacterium]|jgi:ribonuclease R|nr:VacB/RNase II family 3'-5' exoribonuclease [Clostridiales bacterium]